MGIVARAIRLCKADLHGVMDQMEDKDLLLRQHLREMQAVLAHRQARIEGFEEALRAWRRERSMAEKRFQTLEEDLNGAVARGRDDIARMLIRKLIPLRRRVADMVGRLEETMDRRDHERERLRAQRLAYDETRQRVTAARERVLSAALTPEMGPAETDWHLSSPSEEEIEWELLQRKEAAGSGRTT